MQFSSRLPMATHILLAIAVFHPQYKTTSKFLAGSLNVNPVIVRNTLGQLKAAGLVRVRPGEGGSELAKEPEEISLLDIFVAVEKEEKLFSFHEAPNPDCPVGGNIHNLLDGRLQAAEDAMKQKLAETTLQMLLDDLKERM